MPVIAAVAAILMAVALCAVFREREKREGRWSVRRGQWPYQWRPRIGAKTEHGDAGNKISTASAAPRDHALPSLGLPGRPFVGDAGETISLRLATPATLATGTATEGATARPGSE